MPDWTYSEVSDVTASSIAQIQELWNELVREQARELEQQVQITEQLLCDEEERVRKEGEHIKEMERYPLFFWKETCKNTACKK